MTVEEKLRQSLLPVFGFKSIDQIPEDSALINDLGADSLDFVEIVYLIERDFGVVLKGNEMVLAGTSTPADSLFVDGKLTQEGAAILNKELQTLKKTFSEGMTRADLFRSMTVRDLAAIIRLKKGEVT